MGEDLENTLIVLIIGMLPSGFEPESKPREGFMIGHYTTGATQISLAAGGDPYRRQFNVGIQDVVDRHRP